MKINILFFIVSGVVALGIGGFVVWQFNTDSSDAVVPVKETTMIEGAFEYMDDTQPVTGTDTLATLLELGRNIECTFSFKDNDVYSEGTGFFSDGRVRIDALSLANVSENHVSSIIIAPETMYIWGTSDIGSFALKLPTPTSTVAHNDTSDYLSPNEAVSYSCVPWTVDNSVFTPPASVEFLDMSQFMSGN